MGQAPGPAATSQGLGSRVGSGPRSLGTQQRPGLGPQRAASPGGLQGAGFFTLCASLSPFVLPLSPFILPLSPFVLSIAAGLRLPLPPH